MPKKVLIIAGEASSDLHGSNLIGAIKTLDPDIEFFGLGGPLMKAQGVDIKFDIVSRAIIGIIEAFKHLGYFRNIYHQMRELLDKDRPKLAILIDYPGFNLRFARELKKRHIPIIYYISPQIWAWGKNRIRTIKQLVNKMLVIFKFEKELYDSYGIDCEFVGHPLLDIVRPTKDKGIFRKELSLEGDFPVIGILPGSRENEIRCILPVMLEAARLIKNNISSSHFILIKANTVAQSLIDKIIEKYSNGLNIRIYENDKYDLLNILDIALVCSGTATLETGIMKKPMIVIYKVGFFSWLISRSLIKIPNIALVNVVGSKKIVPELIQFKARPSLIAREAVGILKNPGRASDMEKALAAVKELLLPYGASERAARIIVDCLKSNAILV
jgi:lipid-A-disaccharide synthase